MFPIRDTVRSRSFPFFNWVIIILNVLVFFFQSNLSMSGLENFVGNFGIVPSKIDPGNPLTWYPFLTHMWLHGSLYHILSNMWILLIFGDNVEDRLGSFRYILFYLLGGIAAGVAQYVVSVYFGQGQDIPALGASGAIAAVMGAYLLFFPRSRVVTFVPIFLFGWFANIPSAFYLGVWFVSQLLSGLVQLSTQQGVIAGGVAWWAHIGGFLFGLLFAKPFCAGRRLRREYVDEYFPW